MNAKEGCVFAGAVSPSAAWSGVQGGARGHGGAGRGGGGAGANERIEMVSLIAGADWAADCLLGPELARSN